MDIPWALEAVEGFFVQRLTALQWLTRKSLAKETTFYRGTV
jgi:hypothetical protein